MFKGYLLDVFLDFVKSLETPIVQIDEVKKVEENLKFSTDIQDVQDFCFRNGIIGNCNEKCSNYMIKECELMEVK